MKYQIKPLNHKVRAKLNPFRGGRKVLTNSLKATHSLIPYIRALKTHQVNNQLNGSCKILLSDLFLIYLRLIYKKNKQHTGNTTKVCEDALWYCPKINAIKEFFKQLSREGSKTCWLPRMEGSPDSKKAEKVFQSKRSIPNINRKRANTICRNGFFLSAKMNIKTNKYPQIKTSNMAKDESVGKRKIGK